MSPNITKTSPQQPSEQSVPLETEAGVCIEAGKLLAQDSFRPCEAKDGTPFSVVKDGYKLVFHPELMPVPSRHDGTLVLHDLESFCRHFKKYKDSDSIIMVDADAEGKRGAIFTGILNYHGTTAPRHGDFRVQYTAKLSVEWLRFMSKNAVTLSHTAFLEHLEDIRDLIVEPDGAELLELISSLEGKVNARFENALDLHNGRMKLSYAEDVEIREGQQPNTKRGALEVPKEIVAGMAPFEFGDDGYKVKCWLRYRIHSRALVFAYEAKEAHRIIADAVRDQVCKIKELTGTEPLYGVPPAK